MRHPLRQRRNPAATRLLGALASWAPALAGGCSDGLPPISYETARAEIGSSLEAPLCAGDLQFIDDQIAFVEEATDVTAGRPLKIYLFESGEVPCEGTELGCYHHERDYIATVWSAVDHEIVHAVTRPVHFDSGFWEEGLAVALSVEGTHRGSELSVGDLQSDHPQYATAGHFTRWLFETHGAEPLRRVLDGEPPEDAYETPLTGLVEAYERDAPYAYPWWEICPYPEIPASAAGLWQERVTFSCDSPGATQMEWSGASVVRSLSLEEGSYSLRVDGGEGVLLVGCQLGILDEPPPELANGDVFNQAEYSQTAFGKFFASNQEHVLHLTDGLYKLALSSGVNDVATIEVSVRRL